MTLRHTLCVLTSLLVAGCAPPLPVPEPAEPPPSVEPEASEAPAPAPPVRPGVEVLLDDSLHLVRDRRVGFLTNHSAVTRDGRSAIDLLHERPDVNLVALYGPEHGLRGGIEGGVRIEDARDEQTGLPIYSLYGAVQRPTPEMLAGIDVLVFDMQDIGARPYTFIWTMAMAMEAAAEQGLPFIVLDRPNPITDRMEGPVMEMEMRNVGQPITGYYPVPLRHGMTMGEMAWYVNEEFDVGADLTVIPAEGWSAGEWFDETELPWIDPSPNIRSLEAALTYSGLVLLEATNLTVGRGTPAPFSIVGAPWLNASELQRRMSARDIPGIRWETTRVVPEGEGWVPFRGEEVHAVRLVITDRDAFPAVRTTLEMMHEISQMHPDEFEITNIGMTQMLGSRWARDAFEAGLEPEVIQRRWDEELEAWRRVRERYRLYPTEPGTG